MKTRVWVLLLSLAVCGWADARQDGRGGGRDQDDRHGDRDRGERDRDDRDRGDHDDKDKDKKDVRISITAPAHGAVLTNAVVDVTVSFSSKREEDDDREGNGKIESIVLRANGANVASFDVPRRTRSGTHTFQGVDLSAQAAVGGPITLVARAFLGKNKKKFVDSQAVVINIQTDRTAPQISALVPVGGSATNNPRPPLSAQVSDTGGSGIDPASIVVKLDGAAVPATVTLINPNLANVASAPPANLAEGSHTLTVDAKDRAGNAAVQATSTFLVDFTAPSTSITAPAGGLVTKNPQVDLAATVSDAGGAGVLLSSVVVKLDGSPVAAAVTVSGPNAVQVTFSSGALSGGQHTYTVDAQDRSGNAAATASSAFTVDLAPPVLVLSPAEGSRVQGPKPSLTATYSDAIAGVELSTFKATLDGADVAAGFVKGPASATFTPATAIADGPHILRVELADRVGNLAQASTLFIVESALATVGAQGGTVEVTDPSLRGFGTRIVIPPGALSQDILIFIEEVASPPSFPAGYEPAGPAMDIGPSMVFSQPVTIAIPYDPQLVAAPGGSPNGLRLLTFDIALGVWILVPVTAIDTQNHLLLAEVTRIDGAIYRVGDPVVSPTQSLVGVSAGNVVADGISFTTLTITPLTDSGVVVGPGEIVEITVNGVAATVSAPVDLGNGVYQVFISSPATGTATVEILVNGVALPQQTIGFTPVPASFGIDGFTSPIAAGVASNLRITARDQNGATLTSFVGSVEIDLTGTRDAWSVLIFPDSFVATFTSTDAGVITLPNAVVFARSGLQQVSALYVLRPSVTGMASVSVTAGPPAILTKIGGDRQSGATGTQLPQRLAVRLTDLFGNPVQGAQVQFSVTSGGARFSQ